MLHIFTNRHVIYRKFFKFIFIILWILVVNFIDYFMFYFPLLGIIFNVFYQVDCEGQVSAIAHFFFVHCCPPPFDDKVNG